MEGILPVTLPINATEDRVIGGWKINELVQEARTEWQQGLLQEANRDLLYIDEVNLLDNHIVNIILDVSSTGVLVIQQQWQSQQEQVSFVLVGTMNPEEGSLRPQLLDRFGLMVSVEAETDLRRRAKILKTVMDFEQNPQKYVEESKSELDAYRNRLMAVKKQFQSLTLDEELVGHCVQLTTAFKAVGNRGDYTLALAARACAAWAESETVTPEHLKRVAPLVLQHRRPEFNQGEQNLWTDADDKHVEQKLSGEPITD